jgi:GTP-binding protein EngB required for normal cell division
MQDLLTTIRAIAQKQDFQGILREAGDLEQFTQSKQWLDVVILGQFKAGKSSLINSFLKRDVLPMGVLPVTAIITRLVYAPQDKVVITRLDGSKFEISMNELSAYVTEKENPENEKEVYLVDIELPELKDFGKLRLIDTPGLGSAFKHNTAVTENWFNRIGAAFVVISAAQPLSENDQEVIKTAAEQSPEVYLVLSKTDLLSKPEVGEVMDFLKAKSLEATGRDFRVFPYSIKDSVGKFRSQIQNTVLNHLSGHLAETQQNIYSHKLIHLRSLTQSYLEIRLNLASKKDSEREMLKNKILDEQLKLKFIQKELGYIAQSYENSTRDELEKEVLRNHLEPLRALLIKEFHAGYDSWTGNLYKISRNYEAWLKENMAKTLDSIEKQEHDFANDLLANAQIHLNNYTSHFRERLNQRINEVLHVQLPEEDFQVNVEPLEKPDIITSWAFESHIDLLWFLIPMKFFRNVFRKSFAAQLPNEAEKNLRRLISILTKNINIAIRKSHDEALHYITGKLESIEHLLAEQHSGEEEIQEYLQQLAAFEPKVERGKRA